MSGAAQKTQLDPTHGLLLPFFSFCFSLLLTGLSLAIWLSSFALSLSFVSSTFDRNRFRRGCTSLAALSRLWTH